MGKESKLTQAMWKSMEALHNAGDAYDALAAHANKKVTDPAKAPEFVKEFQRLHNKLVGELSEVEKANRELRKEVDAAKKAGDKDEANFEEPLLTSLTSPFGA
jgi:hypothetical protein